MGLNAPPYILDGGVFLKENKICAVCHSKYLYCPVCKKDEDKPIWMFVFCSENCHDIYKTTSAYGRKEMTTKEAKDKLDRLDLSKLDNFGESYKNIISEINEATKVVKEKKVAKATNINKKEGILEDVSTGKEECGNLDVE